MARPLRIQFENANYHITWFVLGSWGQIFNLDNKWEKSLKYRHGKTASHPI